MEISISKQLLTVLFSIVLGLFCGIIYDLFKIFRVVITQNYDEKTLNKLKEKQFKRITNPIMSKEIKSHKAIKLIVVGLLDIIYFFTLLPIFCVFTYVTNEGEFRWFIFVFALFGVIAYKKSFGRLNGLIIAYFSFYFNVLVAYLLFFSKIPIKRLNNKIKMYFSSRKAKKKEKIREIANKELLISFGK